MRNNEKLNFNSIKVRLEHSDEINAYLASDKFQFHKGTIRTTAYVLNMILIKNFNSIKVRLEQPLMF